MSRLSSNHAVVLLLSLWAFAGCTSTPESLSSSAEQITLPEYREALSLMQEEQFQSAEPLLLELTRDHPELAGPWVNLGIVYTRVGRTEDAYSSLLQAIERNSKSAPAYNQLGILHRQAGRFEEAREAYQHALESVPDYSYAHLNLGVLYDLYLQQPAMALEHYQRYQELSQEEDRRVSLWITELERRLRANDQSTEGVSQ